MTSFSVRSRSSLALVMPALLTSIVGLPIEDLMALAVADTAVKEDTSHTKDWMRSVGQ